jgi:PqqD family protein of HPr-rel-A system
MTGKSGEASFAQSGHRINSLLQLHWRPFGDEWVLFEAVSGHTHQMDTLTAVTLMMFAQTSVQLPELVSQVAAELELPVNQALSDTLSGILERLAAAGLIESVVS